MPQLKVLITGLSKLKTKSELNEDSGELVTRVQFEAVISPASIATIHDIIKLKAPINAVLGSSQAVMDLAKGGE